MKATTKPATTDELEALTEPSMGETHIRENALRDELRGAF